MEELKKFLASKDVSASDVGKAVIIHEVLGVTVMISAWAGCFVAKPSRNILNALQLRNRTEWIKAQEKIKSSSLVRRIQSSKHLSSSTASGLAVAFGESYFLRKLLMPVLVPLKLWGTYEFVKINKISSTVREQDNESQ